MTENSSNIIADFIEISYDIIKKKVDHSYRPKFIVDFCTKYYFRKLIKDIKSIKKKNIVLMKYNIQELLIYLITFHGGNYRNISNVSITNNVENSTSAANILIDMKDDPVYNKITILLTIKTHGKIVINYTMTEKRGIIFNSKVEVDDLYYNKDKLDLPKERMLKELNDTLIDSIEHFLLEYMERYNNKGYIKETKE